MSLTSDQVFRIRARPMSSCCFLELDHLTSLKRVVQNDGEKGFHCTGRCDQKNYGRFALSPFRPNSELFRPNSKSFRPNLKLFRPNLKLFRPNLKLFRPNLKLFRILCTLPTKSKQLAPLIEQVLLRSSFRSKVVF